MPMKSSLELLKEKYIILLDSLKRFSNHPSELSMPFLFSSDRIFLSEVLQNCSLALMPPIISDLTCGPFPMKTLIFISY